MTNVTEQLTLYFHPWLLLGVVVGHSVLPTEEFQDGYKAITSFKQSQAPDSP